MSVRLELAGVSKKFGGRVAIEDVSLHIHPGEIVGVLGENGAGKSTLMNIVYGLLRADKGEIKWEGKPVRFANPFDAREQGIGIVMQHFSVFGSMSVLENLYLHTSLLKKEPIEQFAKRVGKQIKNYRFDLSLDSKVGHLSVGQQQKLELLRCLIQDHLKLLILDEPTAVLTSDESDSLITLLKRLSASGCSILYITHKLREVSSLASRVVVLRQGKTVAHGASAPFDEDSLVTLMMGGQSLDTSPVSNAISNSSSLNSTPVDPRVNSGSTLLELNALNFPDYPGPGRPLLDASFVLRAGEIVGIAGVSGNGQDALVDTLSGEYPCGSGDIVLDGQKINKLGLAERYRLGLSVLTADRMNRSSSISQNLIENYYLKSRLKTSGVSIHWKNIEEQVESIIEMYSVDCSGPLAIAKSLSGGNLQKFIIGREIFLAPKVLVCHQPTWGVDVLSAQFIRSKLKALARDGAAVVVISEDLEELFALCHKIGALYSGTLSETCNVSDTSMDEIGALMAGKHHPAQNGERFASA